MQFVRTSEGELKAIFGIEEAFLLRSLPARLEAVFKNPGANRRASERFFPDAYSDGEKNAEYKRLLGEDLRDRKLACLELFRETLGKLDFHKPYAEIRIDDETFAIWLGFLNDCRIYLGVELGIDDDDWSLEFNPDHPRAEDLSVLHYLTWLEEELLQASDMDIPQFGPEDLQDDDD